MLTGKRTPPVWLILLTALAIIVVLIGGILLLIFLRNDGGVQDISETVLGVIALLIMILFPTFLVARYYLRLENPITILRSNISSLQSEGTHLKLQALLKDAKRPTTFMLETRSADEANTIISNINVRVNGRLRVYPITYLRVN